MNLLHRFNLLLITLLLVGSVSAKGTVVQGTFQSAAIGSEQPYQVYIPEGATEEKRLPSLYVLHGAYGSNKDWLEKTDIEELADKYQMILVFPDGGQFGWYVDSPLEKASQYETAVAKELVAEVDGKYPTLAKAEARAIMGLSMGGHGAISLAIKHPDVFSSASSMSGILRIDAHPDKWEIVKRLGPLEENRAVWEANSVYHLVERLKDKPLPILFDCGEQDAAAIEDNRALHARLYELKIPHIWRSFPGKHDWAYWGGHLQEHFNFHQANMIAAYPDVEKWFGLYYKREKLFFDENAAVAVDPPTSPTLAIVGSSSAHGFKSNLLPEFRIYNRGISADRIGLTSRGVSQRVEESIFDMKPDVIVFKIGRNDLSAAQSGNGHPTLEELSEHYEGVIRQIRSRLPNTKLLITSAFPVRDKYARLKEPILPWNVELAKIATRNDAVYLDVHTPLIGEDGLAKPENSSDGLHLSAKGYAAWAAAIREGLKARAEAPKAEEEMPITIGIPAGPPGVMLAPP